MLSQQRTPARNLASRRWAKHVAPKQNAGPDRRCQPNTALTIHRDKGKVRLKSRVGSSSGGFKLTEFKEPLELGVYDGLSKTFVQSLGFGRSLKSSWRCLSREMGWWSFLCHRPEDKFELPSPPPLLDGQFEVERV
jgi:hypothetical protein